MKNGEYSLLRWKAKKMGWCIHDPRLLDLSSEDILLEMYEDAIERRLAEEELPIPEEEYLDQLTYEEVFPRDHSADPYSFDAILHRLSMQYGDRELDDIWEEAELLAAKYAAQRSVMKDS